MAVKPNYVGRLVLIISMLLVCSPAFGAIIVNGGFETVPGENDTTISGWTLTDLSLWEDTYIVSDMMPVFGLDGSWPPNSGTYAAYIGPMSMGFLSQDLTALDPNKTYDLKFAVSMYASPESGGLSNFPNAFEVDWNGNQKMSWEDADPSDWTPYTITNLKPNGDGTATVAFGFYAPGWAIGLDDVQLVPEPASLLLLGTGLMSAGWYLRRKMASGG